MQRETRVERPAERHQLPVARRGYPRKQLDTSPYTHSDPESLATAVKVVSLTPDTRQLPCDCTNEFRSFDGPFLDKN